MAQHFDSADKYIDRRQARRDSRSGHPTGKPATSPAFVALHRVDQEVGSLLAFMTWHRQHGISSDHVPVLEHMIAFFPIYADLSGGAAVTAMDPGRIAEHVLSLNERDAEFAASFCAALHEYMHFLGKPAAGPALGKANGFCTVSFITGCTTKNFPPQGGRAREPQAVVRPPAKVREGHGQAPLRQAGCESVSD
jgi:hypothetical protein